MATRTFAVDLGAWSVKLAIASPGIRGATLLNVVERMVPPGDEPIEDRMRQALAAVIEELRLGDETGFIGVSLVLLTFGFVFWRLVRTAEHSRDPFASLVPIGLLGSWFAHVLVNVGMTVGIMPITGIPLPFISYGGSFLLLNIGAMALVQRIGAETAR